MVTIPLKRNLLSLLTILYYFLFIYFVYLFILFQMHDNFFPDLSYHVWFSDLFVSFFPIGARTDLPNNDGKIPQQLASKDPATAALLLPQRSE